jgi:arylsulfatase A-like enzyme
MKPEDVEVPSFLPDTPEIRSDILDYYYEVQLFDQQVEELLAALDAAGQTENTMVVVTSDNGMPFPGSKANLYDIGVHMPLAIRWPARVKGGRKANGFVSHTDFAPTFLEAAGLKPPPEMTGRSLFGLLAKGKSPGRDAVFFERERHANVRAGNLSYPMRGVRTRDFHYIWNPMPDRWPAGDPREYSRQALGFGDIDGSPSKELVILRREDKDIAKYFRLACEKRPEEELFDLRKDPWQLENVADKPEYADAKKVMRARLETWMAKTADPRAANPNDDRWDKYQYFGKPGEWVAPKPKS